VVALVTGANGFLGRWISAGLEADGWQVIPAGRPQTEVPSDDLDALLRRARPSLVVHCAGPASVQASVANPLADFRHSVGVLAALADALRRLAPSARLLLISSAAVYGQPERLPVDEEAPLRPVSPYGFHRLACELVLSECNELYGLPAASLRVFSAYGERLRRQILWDVCRMAVEDRAVVLDGTGEESRDFVHASDVAQAVRCVAERGAFRGEAYNTATGEETSIRRVAELLLDALGIGAALEFTGRRRAGDPLNWQADVSRIGRLGFRPIVTMEAGAASYARWARNELREHAA
jgi:UDP-glucose 4-epimerase